MRRVFPDRALLVPAVLVCLAATLAAQSASPPPARPPSQTTGPRGTVTTPAGTGTATLRGTVVAADTGTPVRRAVVRASSSQPPDSAVGLSDDQGHFEIAQLAGGRYTISVSKPGFVPVTYGQRRPNERGTPVDVAPAGMVDKLTIGLPRGGVISGRIVDERGEPVADAQVRAMRRQFMPGGRRFAQTGRSDQTDDQGSFRLFGLMPGEYVVAATAPHETAFMLVNGRPPQGADTDRGYAPTYYPGTPSQADAQRIAVAVGQEVSGVTFGMTPTRVAQVSGRVIGAPPEALDSSFIMVMPDDGDGIGASTGGGMVQRDGTFTISGVTPGGYVLRAQPRGGVAGSDALAGITSITVAGADLDDVVIALRKPSAITGRIEFEGGFPAGLAPGQVRVSSLPVNPTGRSFAQGPPRVNDDLTFVIRGATGLTLIRAGNVPGWNLKSVHVGGEDITDTPVMIEPGAEVRDVRIVLSQASSSLSGSVRDERGNAVADASVVLFPLDETKWTFSSRYVRMTRPGADGQFEMRGLPHSADYRIIALQGVEDMQGYDPEFLASIRDRADSLALAPGEAKTIDVKLR